MARTRRTTPFCAGTLLAVLTLAVTSPALAQRAAKVPLTAPPARLTLVSGGPTDMFAYNGRFPGPTLEFREGDRVTVHFKNELPEPTTVHWHGLHLPFTSDGSPFHPVGPGE